MQNHVPVRTPAERMFFKMFKLRLISLFTALSLLFVLFGSVCAFAAETEEIDAAQLEELLGDYTISDSDFAALLSGSDVPSGTDHISDFETYVFKAKQHRLSMTVPKFENGFNINSTNADISEQGYSLEDVLSYNDQYSGSIVSYLFSDYSENGQVMVSILYLSNNYTQIIGDYSKLSDEQLEDIRTAKLSFNNEYPELRKINGNTYLFSCGDDEEYGFYSYSLETIVNGGRYQVYIDLTDPTQVDLAAATEMIRSLKIGGLKSTLYGAADKTLVTVMLIALCVLFAVVCLLTFFIIRFSRYASAAGSKFNIIGFNMPPKKDELEKYAKEQRRAERKAKQNAAKNAPKQEFDRSVSLSDSLSDDE